MDCFSEYDLDKVKIMILVDIFCLFKRIGFLNIVYIINFFEEK